jgi:hypothetical protein
MPEIDEVENRADIIALEHYKKDTGAFLKLSCDIAQTLREVHEMAVDKCVAVAYREDAEHRSRFDINHIATELSRLKKSNS